MKKTVTFYGWWNEEGGIKTGVRFPESICGYNSGEIDVYLRIMVYKYFVNDKGEKITTLAPNLIELETNNSDWVEDEEAHSSERSVYYYKKILTIGDTTTPVIESIRLSPEISNQYKVTRENDGKGNTIIKTVPLYEGARAVLEVEVDAVQTHNAADAIKSAWGREVEIAAGTLSLK